MHCSLAPLDLSKSNNGLFEKSPWGGGVQHPAAKKKRLPVASKELPLLKSWKQIKIDRGGVPEKEWKFIESDPPSCCSSETPPPQGAECHWHNDGLGGPALGSEKVGVSIGLVGVQVQAVQWRRHIKIQAKD